MNFMLCENCYLLWNKDRIVYELEGILRIGADDDDVMEIGSNPDIWLSIINKLDGKTSVNDLVTFLENEYFVSTEDAHQFLTTFKEYNLIELLEKPYEHNDWDKYYQSVFTYYSSEGLGGRELLQEFNDMKITVLGCGGGGTQIASHLLSLGVKNLHLVDPDTVEMSNVNRQYIFGIKDIGRRKVDSTKNFLLQKDPDALITTSTKRMKTVSDVIGEIKESDWVFCAMDEPPYIAQRIVNTACMQLNIPSLYAFSQRSAGKLFMVNPNKSGCVDCLLQKVNNNNFEKMVDKFMSNTSELITATIYPHISLLGSWIVKKWFNTIIKDEDNWNVLYRFDFDNFKEQEFNKFSKNKNCPTCGTIGSKDKLWETLEIK